MKPVCLVIGAGAGIGGNVGKRFAAGGYHTVLCRRSDEEGLQQLVADIEATGGSQDRSNNVLVRMRPERWLTLDYGKQFQVGGDAP
jgi:NAD(P)-dependent dehydrogenase (short-subunit alcohol dehydrogenase family)